MTRVSDLVWTLLDARDRRGDANRGLLRNGDELRQARAVASSYVDELLIERGEMHDQRAAARDMIAVCYREMHAIDLERDTRGLADTADGRWPR